MGSGSFPLIVLTRAVLALVSDDKYAPLPGDPAKPNAWYRDTLSGLLQLLAAGKLRPIVAERIPLVDAARAHQLLERGGHAASSSWSARS